ncbi:MAG: ROK family transcriptional regulator [Actinomycetota bacterium]
MSRAQRLTDRHELVRRANVETVFRAIGDHGPVSRNDLVGITGLSKPTVLAVVAALEDEGLVHGVPLPSTGAGRIPIGYQHNAEAAAVVGIDLGGTKTLVAIADLAGRILAEHEEPTSQAGGPAVVEQLSTLARRVARDAGVAWNRVDAVTVGSPGVVAPDGTLDLATNIAGLGTVHLAADLRRALRTAVQVENDVNLAAVGELHAGVAHDCRTFVLLALGTGVGMGLVVERHLVRGARGAAGEVAYLPIGSDPRTTEARRRGALEVAVSGSGVQAMLRDELALRNGHAGPTALTRRSDARQVFAAAATGDSVGAAVVDRYAQTLAEAVLGLAALIDPEMVVLGGGIGSNPALLAPLRAAVARLVPWPLRIETSALGARAGLVGALHHALASLPSIESHRVSARLFADEGATR